MKREEFEHVIRAAADIVEDEIVVIGSQAIHGQFSEPPQGLLVSRELDVYPRTAPERAGEIDGAIGDGSLFDSSFGYYAHGVGPETPVGTRRLARSTGSSRSAPAGAPTGCGCLEVHDLVLSKLAAGRPHDLEFSLEAIVAELVDPEQLRRRLDLMPAAHREITTERLNGLRTRISAGR